MLHSANCRVPTLRAPTRCGVLQVFTVEQTNLSMRTDEICPKYLPGGHMKYFHTASHRITKSDVFVGMSLSHRRRRLACPRWQSGSCTDPSCMALAPSSNTNAGTPDEVDLSQGTTGHGRPGVAPPSDVYPGPCLLFDRDLAKHNGGRPRTHSAVARESRRCINRLALLAHLPDQAYQVPHNSPVRGPLGCP